MEQLKCADIFMIQSAVLFPNVCCTEYETGWFVCMSVWEWLSTC